MSITLMIEELCLNSLKPNCGLRALAMNVGVFCLLASCCSTASGEEQPLVKLSYTAQTAFEQGKFKKAQTIWSTTIHGLEDNGQNDSFLELCLKRLGQSYMRLENRIEAFHALTRARDMCTALGLQDDELQNELLQLSKIYRSVDPLELGEGTAKALQKANVTSVSLMKTGDASKMQVDLPEKFEKSVEDNSIDSLSFDKQVTLDVEELPDGTVLLKNIKGLKLHAKEYKLWVNLLQATISPEDANGSYPAAVTAGKMGVTKTVTAVLPHKGFEPLAGVLKQLRAMSNPQTPQTTMTSEPATKLEVGRSRIYSYNDVCIFISVDY
jgi:hypothetical protein